MGEEIWRSDEAPAYPINAGEEKPRYTGTYMIARLKPATVYMARVSSQNNYGYSHPSEVFKFATRGAGRVVITNYNIVIYNTILPLNILSIFFFNSRSSPKRAIIWKRRGCCTNENNPTARPVIIFSPFIFTVDALSVES